MIMSIEKLKEYFIEKIEDKPQHIEYYTYLLIGAASVLSMIDNNATNEEIVRFINKADEEIGDCMVRECFDEVLVKMMPKEVHRSIESTLYETIEY